jgi:hypothetical protein
MRLRELAGEGGVLTAIFRVISLSNMRDPAYFSQKWRIPPIAAADADGEVELEGAFIVGEGDYQVDWLVRDTYDRVCSAYWRVSARSNRSGVAVAAALPAGSIVEAGADRDRSVRTTSGNGGDRRRLVVLLHIGSSVSGASAIPVQEKEAILAMLRSIAREPGIGSSTIIAFNLDNRLVIFRRDGAREIDVAGLDMAIDSLKMGTISVNVLADKDAEARFLAGLIADPAPWKDADGVVFLGASRPTDARFTDEMLQQIRHAGCPVFYLSYSPGWNDDARPDLIGSAVRHWRGYKFNITNPPDFASAWSNIMSRIAQREYIQTATGSRQVNR